MAKVELIKRPIGQIGGELKKSAWMMVAESLIMAIVGILLVAWPEVVIKVLAYVVGTFFVIKGGYQIVNYFVVKGQKDFFNNDLLWGVIGVLIGATAFVMGEEIAGVFRVVVGVWMIYEALTRMNTAIKLNSAKISMWKYVLILALVMLVLGVFVTFNTGAVTILIGWMMIVDGFVAIIGDIMFIQQVNTVTEKLTNFGDERA